MKTRADNSNKPAKAAVPAWDATHSAGMFVPAQQVQTKLTVGIPGDKLEQEADATAQSVMAAPVAPALQEKETVRLKEAPEEEATAMRKEAPEEETVQRQCADCQTQQEEEATPAETIQRQTAAPTGGQAAPPIVGEVVSSGGHALDADTRGDMEHRFGTDFSQVRVHNDGKAQDSARAISAQAYTYRQHIAFAPGQYAPHTPSGRQLLAHELTHVVQQSGEVRRRIDPGAAPVNQPPVAPVQTAPQPAAPTAVPDDSAAVPAAAAPLPQIAVPIEPLLPAPPETLGPAAQQRLRQSQAAAETTATATATVPDADAETQAARAGVTEPDQEADARASGALAATLGERPAPSPEILELCERIREVIRSKRPPDEDSLLRADPEAAANEAGSQLNDNIDGDVDRIEGEYNALDENPTGTPEQIGVTPPTTPETISTPDLRAAGAAPDPLAPEDVSLDADVAASEQQMENAGMNTPAAQAVQDGPIAEARAAQGELVETAAEDPALVLAEQEAALGNARADMETLQAQALAALQASRSSSVAQSGTQQTDMVRDEVSQRETIAQAAEDKFTAAQTQVNALLTPLPEVAMNMWNTGKDRIATEFENHLARVQRWVDDRHSGFGGGLVELWDDLTGLPGWVTDEYNAAERTFGDDVCQLITDISVHVNGIILTCEEIIDTANREIDTLFANAGPELAEWAAGERAKFQERLDGLREQVSTTQQDFNRDLTERASQAVQEVRERVHALREAAKGLLGRIADALMEFLEDPVRAIINGLLRLVGIDPGAFWALAARIEQVITDIADDPLGFASNLLSAIGAGFQLFFDNFFTNLLEGFIQWVFSGLGAVGVEIPRDLSLGSIITFFLQLMGITWDRVRALLARHIGEENVALLEQAYSIISNLIALGPAGIYELIKDQLNPQQLLNQVIEMAVNFVTETIVAQATIRIIGLFNPVGAIAQAIEAIYRVLRWIFENAARIFTLVETVVNGIADIVAGNIAGMAATVERALKQLLVPVIDFIAGFLGLGNLPERVANMVRGMQNWVEGILDRVIGWLAGRARALLEALGIGGEEREGTGLEDTEVGERIGFQAEGEQHHVWVSVNGGQVEVMVASDNPMPISARLTQWEGRISTLPEDDQPRARTLIGRVREQNNLTKREGEQSKEAIEVAQQQATPEAVAAAQREDDQVEQAERAMTPELGELFDLFEGGVTFHPIQEAVQVGSGSLEVGIYEASNHRLEVRLSNEEIGRQLIEVANGPLGTAHHRAGRNLVRNIVVEVSPLKNSIRAVTVNEGKIPASADRLIPGWMMDVKSSIAALTPTKAQGMPHLTTMPPTAQANKASVTFNQQLGNSETISREYDRQLRLQQEGLNRLTIDQWVVNRNAYSLNEDLFDRLDADQKRAVLIELKNRADAASERARERKVAFNSAANEISQALEHMDDAAFQPDFSKIHLVTNRFGNEGSWRSKRKPEINAVIQALRTDAADWQTVFDTAAVLHNADQIAGGFGMIPDLTRIPRPTLGEDDSSWQAYLDNLKQYVGSSNVNSSIGSLWRNNIAGLEQTVHAAYDSPAWPIWKMNVELKRG